MKYFYVLLILFILCIPTNAQEEPSFILLNQFEFTITANDPGDEQFSRYFILLNSNFSVPENADEVLIQLQMTDQSVATGLEFLLTSDGINSNETHPIQSTKHQHSLIIDPLTGLTDVSLWIHWYSLFENTSCTGCDFQYSSSVQVRFFTSDQNWQSSLKSSGSISHRERVVTLEDFLHISISSPGVNIGTAKPTPSTNQDTDMITTTTTQLETTTVDRTIEPTISTKTTNVQKLSVPITFVLVGVFITRRMKAVTL